MSACREENSPATPRNQSSIETECRGRPSASCSGRGKRYASPDRRLHDLAELAGMRRRHKDALRAGVSVQRAPAAPATRSRCAGRAGSRGGGTRRRSPPRSARRRTHSPRRRGGVPVDVVAVDRLHPLQVARRADVHGVGDRPNRRLRVVVARSAGTAGRCRSRWWPPRTVFTGSPRRLAIRPAVRLPKLPLGTDTIGPPSSAAGRAPG